MEYVLTKTSIIDIDEPHDFEQLMAIITRINEIELMITQEFVHPDTDQVISYTVLAISTDVKRVEQV